MNEPRNEPRNEPTEPKLEYQLSNEEFELIHQVDFRLNNLLTSLIGSVSLAQEKHTQLSWSNDRLEKLRLFLTTQIRNISDHETDFQQSSQPTMQQLGEAFSSAAGQLTVLVGAIIAFQTTSDLSLFERAVRDVHDKMRPAIYAITHNQAYQAYRNKIESDDLEATRNSFTI